MPRSGMVPQGVCEPAVQQFANRPCPPLQVQKPANAFQRGVQRVSYLLIGFMAAMVPVRKKLHVHCTAAERPKPGMHAATLHQLS